MVPFGSSSVAAGGYDSADRVLRLRYIDGDAYDYLDVPSSVFRALLEAPLEGTVRELAGEALFRL